MGCDGAPRGKLLVSYIAHVTHLSKTDPVVLSILCPQPPMMGIRQGFPRASVRPSNPAGYRILLVRIPLSDITTGYCKPCRYGPRGGRWAPIDDTPHDSDGDRRNPKYVGYAGYPRHNYDWRPPHPSTHPLNAQPISDQRDTRYITLPITPGDRLYSTPRSAIGAPVRHRDRQPT